MYEKVRQNKGCGIQETGRSPNLSHLLSSFGGSKYDLPIQISGDRVRHSLEEVEGKPVETTQKPIRVDTILLIEEPEIYLHPAKASEYTCYSKERRHLQSPPFSIFLLLSPIRHFRKVASILN